MLGYCSGTAIESHQAANSPGGANGPPIVSALIEANEEIAREIRLDQADDAMLLALFNRMAREKHLKLLVLKIVFGNVFLPGFGMNHIPAGAW